MAAQKKSVVLTFDQERETKNTVRFQERPNESGVTFVGTLYVQKSIAMALGSMPETLTVTVQG